MTGLVRGLLRRLVHLVIVLVLVSIGTFALLNLSPGDPAGVILGPNATAQSVRQVDHQLGLDRPLVNQFWSWLSGALHGNLGTSLIPPQSSVASQIGQALPISLELAFLAIIMAVLISVPVALWSAYREGGIFDKIATDISFGLLSVPSFVLALVMALIFSLYLHWLPRSQWVRLMSSEGLAKNLTHAFLPAFTLALGETAIYIRVLRADLIRTLQENFIGTAKATGIPVRRVLVVHALRPSSFSLLTMSGISLGRLIGGTVIVEVIFGLPGIGHLLVNAVGNSDYPLVQGIVLVAAVAYVVVNELVNVSYLFLDPRTRRGDS
jgi:peptide/nickel transport system permease protein